MIGLNLSTLRGFGSGIVGCNVVEAMIAQRPHGSFLAWIPEAWGWDGDRFGKKARIVPVAGGPIAKFTMENVDLRIEAARGRVDCLFSLSNSGIPGCPVPHLVLVHNSYIVYRESEWRFNAPTRFRAQVRLQKAYFALGLPTVRLFTVQTHHMKLALVRRWGVPKEKIVVIPSSIEATAVSDSQTASQEVRHNSAAYVCYVANDAPQKNHTVLAHMMAELGLRFHDLRCKVTVSREQVPALVLAARRYGVLDKFDFLGPLSLHESRSLIAGCEVFVMPSKLESFGIPYLEAMSLGRPMVAADLECSREMCADGALYAEPDSGKAFAETVGRVLERRDEHQACAIRGKARFASIAVSWTEIAQRYMRLLDDLR